MKNYTLTTALLFSVFALLLVFTQTACHKDDNMGGNTTNSTTDLGTVVTLITPFVDAPDQPIYPRFTWKVSVATVDSSEICYGTDITFATCRDTVVNALAWQPTSAPLQRLTTYYWRVRSWVKGVPSKWSAVNKFTTQQSCIDLISPANNAVGQSQTTALRWTSACVNFDTALVWMSDDKGNVRSAKAFLLHQSILPNSSLFIDDMKPYTTYHWKVRGLGAHHDSTAWSPTYSFTTHDDRSEVVGTFTATKYDYTWNWGNFISTLSATNVPVRFALSSTNPHGLYFEEIGTNNHVDTYSSSSWSFDVPCTGSYMTFLPYPAKDSFEVKIEQRDCAQPTRDGAGVIYKGKFH